MIKQISSFDEIKEYPQNDIYSVRIMSLADAYGCKYSFARFYCQLDDENNITAIMSWLDGSVTVSHLNNADYCEIISFFNVIGFNMLLCDDKIEFDMPFTQGAVMSTSKTFEIYSGYVEIDEYPSLMDLFNFIDYEQQDFQSWYVDISHRIRHKNAKAATLNVNGEIISSALFSSIYNNQAILSAVRTAPPFRELGYGTKLVSSMITDFGSTVYIMREMDLNESFYKRIGFKNIGIWRMYK